MWENEIETFGLKGYHNDEWHESDDETMNIQDIYVKPKIMTQPREGEMSRVTRNENGDLQFEGGFNDDNNSKDRKKGFFANILSCGGRSRDKRKND